MTMHESTFTNDFYLVFEEDGINNFRFYHILVQMKDTNNYFVNKELMISLYFPENEENDFYFSFFCHFLFQSPHDIATSSIHSTSSIEKIFIYEENENLIGEEKDLLLNLSNNLSFKKYFISSNIKTFDSEIHKCKLIEKLESGEYLGKISFNLSKNIENDFVFKESTSISFDCLRNLINECMMMKIIENQFIIKLHGICIPSMRIDIIEENNDFDEDEYLNHQLLMITEEAPWGNLTHCRNVIHEKYSTKLKLKIAFDIARGLNSLYLVSGVKLIHRNIKAENIFIFSVDEKSISNFESIHAKLGNFGSIVIAGPSCSHRISNYKYTAPEALRGSFTVPYSKEIDVYSYGILLWEILSGKIPFQELKENPETCDNIETIIIDGYRPSLDYLPYNTPPCIIDIITDCWSPKPSSRPSLGKIISILTIILQLEISDKLEIQKYLPSIESNFQLQQRTIGKNINTSYFSNIQLKGRISDGLLMICDFHLSDSIYNVVLKMKLSQSDISSQEHSKSKINEFNILPQIQHHPNIVSLIGSFQCVPSDEMICLIDESIKDFDESYSKRMCQFYILENYKKTLGSVIGELNEDQILTYSIQLSSALLFLYKNKIVHLDINPDNLMISDNDDLLIFDFGLAMKMNTSNEVILEEDEFQVENSLYLSPEVLAAKTKGKNLPCALQHSWELGMIMFQMFNKGQLPFKLHEFSSENGIDSKIPEKFKSLLASLLNSQQKRIPIIEASDILLQIRNNTKFI